MIKPPCKDCPDRHRACHDDCERYKAYKAELAKVRDARIADAKQFDNLEISKWFRKQKPQR